MYGGIETNGTLWPFASIFGGVAQFTAGMWAFRVPDRLATAIHAVLVLLATGSALLGVGLSLGSTGFVKVGWVLVTSAIAAWYAATAMMLLATSAKVVLPLGKLKKDANIPGSEPVKPIQLEWADKKGQ